MYTHTYTHSYMYNPTHTYTHARTLKHTGSYNPLYMLYMGLESEYKISWIGLYTLVYKFIFILL